MKTVKLLYWDIDGTLLNTGHAGLNAIKEVLRDLKGEDTPVPKIDAGGRTDNYICQQLLYKSTGVMPTDEEVFAFCRNYEQKLLKWLKRKAHEGVILPNAAENLAFFHGREGYCQLLLTGNSRVGASLKMDFFGLSQYFDFDHSGFTFDYYYRDDLARNALAIAKRTWGDDIEAMYVIGDTPHDIQCGKAIGARTIGVATGRHSYDDLAKCEPWKIISSLPEPEAFEALLEL